LEAAIHKNGEVRLRRINIGKWGSPVASQYGINSLPTLHLYEGKKLVSKDRRRAMASLQN